MWLLNTDSVDHLIADLAAGGCCTDGQDHHGLRRRQVPDQGYQHSKGCCLVIPVC